MPKFLALVDGKPFFPLGVYWTHHSKQRWIAGYGQKPAPLPALTRSASSRRRRGRA